MNTRQCPFDGCNKKVPPEKFACYVHWCSLTRDQQGRIWSAFRQWQGGTLNASALEVIQRSVLNEAQGRMS